MTVADLGPVDTLFTVKLSRARSRHPDANAPQVLGSRTIAVSGQRHYQAIGGNQLAQHAVQAPIVEADVRPLFAAVVMHPTQTARRREVLR